VIVASFARPGRASDFGVSVVKKGPGNRLADLIIPIAEEALRLVLSSMGLIAHHSEALANACGIMVWRADTTLRTPLQGNDADDSFAESCL
jgi:hypothetical protein